MKTTTTIAATTSTRRKPAGVALRATKSQRRPVPASAPQAALLDPPLTSAVVPTETCRECQAPMLLNGTKHLCLNCGAMKPALGVEKRSKANWYRCMGTGEGNCPWKGITHSDTCPRCSIAH